MEQIRCVRHDEEEMTRVRFQRHRHKRKSRFCLEGILPLHQLHKDVPVYLLILDDMFDDLDAFFERIDKAHPLCWRRLNTTTDMRGFVKECSRRFVRLARFPRASLPFETWDKPTDEGNLATSTSSTWLSTEWTR